MFINKIYVNLRVVNNMRNEVLINEVLKELDELILKFNSYYTIKNLKK